MNKSESEVVLLNTILNQQTEVNQFTLEKPESKDFICVNRIELNEVLRDARYVSNTLHNIESLDELDWQEMLDICRTSYRVVKLLNTIIELSEQKEVTVR